MGGLAGDTNGNGSVNASDVSQTKAQSGVAVMASNFRTDVNSNGSINASDVSNVKSRSGIRCQREFQSRSHQLQSAMASLAIALAPF